MVQIQSKQKRGMIASGLLGLIPDILVSSAVSYFFDFGVPGVFGIIIGLQFVYFAIWLKNMAWGWLVFWVSGRRKMASHLEDYLYKNRFPQPPEFVGGIDDYFSQVANDQTVNCALRVKAAVELGTLAGIKTAGRILFGLQLHLAYEDALEAYSRRFPPRDEGQ
jgi:hypothetical protein